MCTVMTAEAAEHDAARNAAELMGDYEVERAVVGESDGKNRRANARKRLDALANRYIADMTGDVIDEADLLDAMTEQDRATYKRLARIALAHPGSQVYRAKQTAAAAEAVRLSSALLASYVTEAEWDSGNIPDFDTLETRLSDKHRTLYDQLRKRYRYHYLGDHDE
jgi:hypothetical protein